jgi:hypothetical protein
MHDVTSIGPDAPLAGQGVSAWTPHDRYFIEFDEDIPANESSTKTPIQGLITRHANKLQQEVHSLLTKIDYNTNENFIMLK